MVSRRKIVLRFILSFILLGIFAVASFYLFKKQSEKFSLLSFRVENEISGIVIPDIVKFSKDLNSNDQIYAPDKPSVLDELFLSLINNKSINFDILQGKSCFISYSLSDFLINFQTPNLSAEEIADFLKTNFELNSTINKNEIAVGKTNLQIHHHGKYSVLATGLYTETFSSEKDNYGNAHYLVCEPVTNKMFHYVLDKNYVHKVLFDKQDGPKGNPVNISSFLKFIPSDFSELEFFGSERINSDYSFYFPDAEEQAIIWADQGFIFVRKDTLQILLAPQNSDRDLKLILEEETLHIKGDSSQINYFNIGSYEIMPFESDIKWPSQKTSPVNYSFFTQLDNFNVLSKDIPSLRWFIGEIQLGNLLVKHPGVSEIFYSIIPDRCHQFQILKTENGQYNSTSSTWSSGSNVITSWSQTNTLSISTGKIDLVHSFELDFIPTYVELMNKLDSSFIILGNTLFIAAYNYTGEKIWAKKLNNELNGKPQIVDLENDGKNEIVLFQKNQLQVLNSNGETRQGFPKSFSAPSSGGIAVNYDNSYNYRFLTNIGNQIKSLDENGNPVIGWMFNIMTSGLKGQISYYVAQGKDMISFKDLNNNQFVINRRGESRLSKQSVLNLPNESSFVVGNMDESSLRKLGFRNNYILNYYLMDAQLDSVKIDRDVIPIKTFWIFNENQPLLVIEETERVVVLDEFGYEKESVLKPIPGQEFAGLEISQGFKYVFVDNSQNTVYLLDGFGKMIFPVPVSGSAVYKLKDSLFFSFVGSRLNVYQIK